MLVQFSFKNFGPFREEAVFDMRAVNAYKEHPEKVITIDEKTKLLKVAAIYGANASGKSNFSRAYSIFRLIVRESMNASSSESGDVLAIDKYYAPYRFTGEYSHSDTEFEAVYIQDGFEYTYGFVYNDLRIAYEWLYRRSLASGRKTVILERNEQTITLGPSVRHSCEKYVEDIADFFLALTFFNRLKLPTTVFKEAYTCVGSVITPWFDDDDFIWDIITNFFTSNYDETKKQQLLSFLAGIDISIKDFIVVKRKEDVNILTAHAGLDGEIHKSSLHIESDGTIKAIALFAFIRLTIFLNETLWIDELDARLHPLLVKYVVDLFYTSDSQAQLVYTTHDTTFLDKRYLRRDQVWFVEKDEHCQSKLYSLAEFKLRPDASFNKSYLGGSFGAIPALKAFAFDVGEDG